MLALIVHLRAYMYICEYPAFISVVFKLYSENSEIKSGLVYEVNVVLHYFLVSVHHIDVGKVLCVHRQLKIIISCAPSGIDVTCTSGSHLV